MPDLLQPRPEGMGICLPRYFPSVKQILIGHLLCAKYLTEAGGLTEKVSALMELTFLGAGAQTVNQRANKYNFNR